MTNWTVLNTGPRRPKTGDTIDSAQAAETLEYGGDVLVVVDSGGEPTGHRAFALWRDGKGYRVLYGPQDRKPVYPVTVVVSWWDAHDGD